MQKFDGSNVIDASRRFRRKTSLSRQFAILDQYHLLAVCLAAAYATLAAICTGVLAWPDVSCQLYAYAYGYNQFGCYWQVPMIALAVGVLVFCITFKYISEWIERFLDRSYRS